MARRERLLEGPVFDLKGQGGHDAQASESNALVGQRAIPVRGHARAIDRVDQDVGVGPQDLHRPHTFCQDALVRACAVYVDGHDSSQTKETSRSHSRQHQVVVLEEFGELIFPDASIGNDHSIFGPTGGVANRFQLYARAASRRFEIGIAPEIDHPDIAVHGSRARSGVRSNDQRGL